MVIADIGGYTRFMKVHRLNLAHAQFTVAQLLEAVIDGAGSLQLAKLEGDAAFFWLPVADSATPSQIGHQLAGIRRGFIDKRSELSAVRMCSCDACLQIEQLTLKFVAHEGEVATQKVKRFVELAGVDVILLHRMLKNDVPLREYALITDSVLSRLDPALARVATALEHDFEGIGPVQTHYLDLQAIEAGAPLVLRVSAARRWWEKILLELRSFPYYLGLRKAPPRGL
jgi:hypothetical protein